MGFVCLFFIAGTAVLTYAVGYENHFIHENAPYLFVEMNTISAIVCAAALFLGFHNLRIGQSRWINRVASVTFGIYLFHDNPLVRHFIWIRVYPLSIDQGNYIPCSILKIALIFLAGLVIDWIVSFLIQTVVRWCTENFTGKHMMKGKE